MRSNLSNNFVALVIDIDIVQSVNYDSGGRVKASGEGRYVAVGPHFSDAIIPRVGDIKIANRIVGDRLRCVQLGIDRHRVVAAGARLAGSGQPFDSSVGIQPEHDVAELHRKHWISGSVQRYGLDLGQKQTLRLLAVPVEGSIAAGIGSDHPLGIAIEAKEEAKSEQPARGAAMSVHSFLKGKYPRECRF